MCSEYDISTILKDSPHIKQYLKSDDGEWMIITERQVPLCWMSEWVIDV